VFCLIVFAKRYVAKGASKIASQNQWMQAYLGVWQQLNSVPKHDVEAFSLLISLTDHMPLPVLDNYLPQILAFIFARLSNPKGKTPRYIKGSHILFLLIHSYIYKVL
jgi:hypothetical protein